MKNNNKNKIIVSESQSIIRLDADIIEKVEASELTMDMPLMKHIPQNDEETAEMNFLIKAIHNNELYDFMRPKMDPAFTSDGLGIEFIAGKNPATGYFFNWWTNFLNKYPEFRIGQEKEYRAFLAVLIKRMIESGISVEEAWKLVYRDSKTIGHCYNEPNRKLYGVEPIGSRIVCGYCDLLNVMKLVAENDTEEQGGCWIAGGSYNDYGEHNPVGHMYHFPIRDFDAQDLVPWLVIR